MTPLEPGLEVVPGLVLLRPLGRGGMGEAWLARDAQRGEDVVAKVLPAGAPADRVALLRREARLVRKLAHPRIVPVHGFRESERGSAITAAYLPGGDASRRRGATPLEVVRLGRDVAEALEYLHALGVVHRDVKASNVLLDATGRAQLADFGIAAAAPGEDDGVAMVGGGSRASMSPQQRAGEPAEPSDDLYALGALLFELLSGRPPFPREASDEEVRTRDAPPVASPYPVPDPLRDLVARLLAKAPSARPATARAVIETLARIERDIVVGAALAGGTAPVRLQPPPRADREDPVIAPGAVQARLDRLRTRPARAGLTAAQTTLLVALAIAAVVAVVWLPRLVTPVAAVPSASASPVAAAVPTQTPAPPETRPAQPEALPAPADAEPVAEPPAAPASVQPARPRDPLSRVVEPAAEPRPEPVPTPDLRQQAEELARRRDAARALEAREEWRAAVAEYDAALAIDAHVTFALEGRLRAVQRAVLAEALDRHLASPLRLSAEAVAREAEALLEKARGVDAPGPRLQAQVQQLEQALAGARTTVNVAIESDGLTEVSVSRVGPLGRLTRRTLELRPGEYTAVGSRHGYRDVRRRFTVSPGATPPAVVVRCEEAL
jgi:serine/threonine-protein kinase